MNARLCFAALAMLALLALCSPPVEAATIVVDNDAEDVVNDDGICSLREAIINSNTGSGTNNDCTGGSGGVDVIVLPAFTHAANLPEITAETEIDGNGGVLSGEAASGGVFQIAADLYVHDAEVRNGNTFDGESGGCFTVTSGSLLTLENVLVSGCRCNHEERDRQGAGGVFVRSGSRVEILNSAFEHNHGFSNMSSLSSSQKDTRANATNFLFVSGGVFLPPGASASVVDSEFRWNDGDAAGAIYSHDSINITRTAFFNNTAASHGGAVLSHGDVTLWESGPLLGNGAELDGGAVHATGDVLALMLDRVHFNRAGRAGGAFYSERGSVLVNDATDVSHNSASNGGVIHARVFGEINRAGDVYRNEASTGAVVYAGNGAILRNISGHVERNYASSNGALFEVTRGFALITAVSGNIVRNQGQSLVRCETDLEISHVDGAIHHNYAVDGTGFQAGQRVLIFNVLGGIENNTASRAFISAIHGDVRVHHVGSFANNKAMQSNIGGIGDVIYANASITVEHVNGDVSGSVLAEIGDPMSTGRSFFRSSRGSVTVRWVRGSIYGFAGPELTAAFEAFNDVTIEHVGGHITAILAPTVIRAGNDVRVYNVTGDIHHIYADAFIVSAPPQFDPSKAEGGPVTVLAETGAIRNNAIEQLFAGSASVLLIDSIHGGIHDNTCDQASSPFIDAIIHVNATISRIGACGVCDNYFKGHFVSVVGPHLFVHNVTGVHRNTMRSFAKSSTHLTVEVIAAGVTDSVDEGSDAYPLFAADGRTVLDGVAQLTNNTAVSLVQGLQSVLVQHMERIEGNGYRWHSSDPESLAVIEGGAVVVRNISGAIAHNRGRYRSYFIVSTSTVLLQAVPGGFHDNDLHLISATSDVEVLEVGRIEQNSGFTPANDSFVHTVDGDVTIADVPLGLVRNENYNRLVVSRYGSVFVRNVGPIARNRVDHGMLAAPRGTVSVRRINGPISHNMGSIATKRSGHVYGLFVERCERLEVSDVRGDLSNNHMHLRGVFAYATDEMLVENVGNIHDNDFRADLESSGPVQGHFFVTGDGVGSMTLRNLGDIRGNDIPCAFALHQGSRELLVENVGAIEDNGSDVTLNGECVSTAMFSADRGVARLRHVRGAVQGNRFGALLEGGEAAHVEHVNGAVRNNTCGGYLVRASLGDASLYNVTGGVATNRMGGLIFGDGVTVAHVPYFHDLTAVTSLNESENRTEERDFIRATRFLDVLHIDLGFSALHGFDAWMQCREGNTRLEAVGGMLTDSRFLRLFDIAGALSIQRCNGSIARNLLLDAAGMDDSPRSEVNGGLFIEQSNLWFEKNQADRTVLAVRGDVLVRYAQLHVRDNVLGGALLAMRYQADAQSSEAVFEDLLADITGNRMLDDSWGMLHSENVSLSIVYHRGLIARNVMRSVVRASDGDVELIHHTGDFRENARGALLDAANVVVVDFTGDVTDNNPFHCGVFCADLDLVVTDLFGDVMRNQVTDGVEDVAPFAWAGRDMRLSQVGRIERNTGEVGVAYAGGNLDARSIYSISRNTGMNGAGAFRVGLSGVVQGVNSSVARNTGSSGAGFMSCGESGTGDAVRCELRDVVNDVRDNTALREYSGGVLSCRNGSALIELVGGDVRGNSAHYGGVLAAANDAVVRLVQGDVRGNTAVYSGGAVFSSAGSAQVRQVGRDVANNLAINGDGGVVFGGLEALVSDVGRHVSGNEALQSHRAEVFLEDLRASVDPLRADYDAVGVGGVAASSHGPATVRVVGGDVRENSASVGGVVFGATSGELSDVQDVLSNLAASHGGVCASAELCVVARVNGSIADNHALEGEGGVLATLQHGEVWEVRDSIADNTASTSGGVASTRLTAVIRNVGGSIERNLASGFGGVASSSVVFIQNVTYDISHNAAAEGGVIRSVLQGVIEHVDGVISLNRAHAGSGGVISSNTSAEISNAGSGICSNEAFVNGGVISVLEGDAVVHGADTKLTLNAAITGQGGVIFAADRLGLGGALVAVVDVGGLEAGTTGGVVVALGSTPSVSTGSLPSSMSFDVQPTDTPANEVMHPSPSFTIVGGGNPDLLDVVVLVERPSDNTRFLLPGPVTVVKNGTNRFRLDNVVLPEGTYRLRFAIPFGCSHDLAVGSDPSNYVAESQASALFDITACRNARPARCPDETLIRVSASNAACSAYVAVPDITDHSPLCTDVEYTNDYNDNVRLFDSRLDGSASGVYPLGNTTVVRRLEPQGPGATVLECPVVVEVSDNTDFIEFRCPNNIVVPADSDQCSAEVEVPLPAAHDNCPFTITNSFNDEEAASGRYPRGETVVRYEIVNDFLFTGLTGHYDFCEFTVTVVDVTPPVISCPASQQLRCNDAVFAYNVTATDPNHCRSSVPVRSLASEYAPAGAYSFPPGETRLDFEVVSQHHGHQDDVTVRCGFEVVVEDTYYYDVDGDGYGDSSTATVFQCNPPEGWVLRGGDCNLYDPTYYQLYFIDYDGDGFPDRGAHFCGTSSSRLPGWALDQPNVISGVTPRAFAAGSKSFDCDDTNPNVHSGAGCPNDSNTGAGAGALVTAASLELPKGGSGNSATSSAPEASDSLPNGIPTSSSLGEGVKQMLDDQGVLLQQDGDLEEGSLGDPLSSASSGAASLTPHMITVAALSAALAFSLVL